ncbi:MAG: type II secretion system F family protein [Cryobacterium sp.]
MVPVSSQLAWGVLCGTALGVGLWSLVSLMPRLSRPRLANRLAPYLLDVSAEARAFVGRQSVDPIPVLGAVFSPAFHGLRGAMSALLGGADATGHRLRQSGSTRSVDAFRSEQLAWALVSLAGATAAVLGLPALRALPLAGQVVLPVIAAISAAFLRDWLLRRAAAARLARMDSELPTILEFLTLSLSAGEGILDALCRVSGTGSGELSRELGGVVADVHAGVPLASAMQVLSRQLQLPAFTRFVDQVTGALDRGSPLAEVLRAQAQDAREATKRGLLEVAGKKEVAMLVPVVFLILPMTILFAVFPGFIVLSAGF